MLGCEPEFQGPYKAPEVPGWGSNDSSLYGRCEGRELCKTQPQEMMLFQGVQIRVTQQTRRTELPWMWVTAEEAAVTEP